MLNDRTRASDFVTLKGLVDRFMKFVDRWQSCVRES